MRTFDALYKSWFILRWYALYNVRLVMLFKKALNLGDKSLPGEVAESLNERRKNAQKAIFGVIKDYGSVCAECKGRCCLEEVDRYTSFDNHIRRALGKPLESYGDTILDPTWMLTNGLRHTLERKYGVKRTPPPCRHLSPAGCGLETTDRPMLCASWFCPTYLRSIPRRDLKQLAKPLKEIESIHKEIVKGVR